MDFFTNCLSIVSCYTSQRDGRPEYFDHWSICVWYSIEKYPCNFQKKSVWWTPYILLNSVPTEHLDFIALWLLPIISKWGYNALFHDDDVNDGNNFSSCLHVIDDDEYLEVVLYAIWRSWISWSWLIYMLLILMNIIKSFCMHVVNYGEYVCTL